MFVPVLVAAVTEWEVQAAVIAIFLRVTVLLFVPLFAMVTTVPPFTEYVLSVEADKLIEFCFTPLVFV